MVPLETFFGFLIVLYGLIGFLRGWAKELLVTFSVILARFMEVVLVTYILADNRNIPGMQSLATIQEAGDRSWFLVRLFLFGIVVAFGYATPILYTRLGSRARKEKIQDALLGFFLGIINGYLVNGIIWGFLDQLGYNIWGITGPETEFAQGIVNYLPLTRLDGPLLFILVAFSFAFVLIVFV